MACASSSGKAGLSKWLHRTICVCRTLGSKRQARGALTILGKTYECSLKKGGQTKALLFNVLETKDCKPFVNRARVVGQRKGDLIHAKEIHLQPIGDQATR